jgi:hypothetical protein
MSVAVYGDLGNLFRLSDTCTSSSSSPTPNSYNSLETWNKPLSVSQGRDSPIVKTLFFN